MIEFKSVCKSYHKNDKKAVDDLTFCVPNGENFVFLGQNGAGKTTAIKILCGILYADSGSVFVDGVNVAEEPVEAKKRFSYVPDTPSLPQRFTGFDYLFFISDIFSVPRKTAQEQISRLSELFGMRSNLRLLISTYSHGMRQKISLIASLISEPNNLILDEPFNGLDPDASFALKEIMKERIKEKKTVFYSTHIMEIAEKLCTKIGIINQGKLLFCGTFEQLQNDYAVKNPQEKNASLEKIFLGIAKSD